MTRKRLLALLLVALGACSTQPSVGSRFNGPTALAPFRGFTRKDAAAIRDYVAVTSSRGDEIRLVDPADLNAVVSPGSVFPLSIPTAPRPLLLASAAMGDEKGDVLVAASAGGAGVESAGPAIQLIETWDATNRVAQDVSLAGVLAAGSDILCLAGIPAVAGTARILVGASGGQLAVIPFTRKADGSGALEPGTPVVKLLTFTGTSGSAQTFDPVDIAASSDGATLYIASRDAVGVSGGNAIFGVAQIATGDIASAAIIPLAAGPKDPDAAAIGAGTVAVATVPSSLLGSRVSERIIDSNNQSSADTLSTPTSFVYAALDPASCGVAKPIACGIVTIDPTRPAADQLVAGSLATDPVASASALTLDSGPAASRAEAQPYRAPMPIPGVPIHISIAGPPASGSQRVTDTTTGTAEFAMAVGPGRNTNAVAMVTASDGHVYWFDLSRWSPPSDASVANTVSVTSVTSAASVTSGYQLGLWQDTPIGTDAPAPAVKTDAGILTAIDVWPGFTDSDTWTLAYQGPLPTLSQRTALLVTTSSATYAAIQTNTGVVATPVADPALGVRDPSTAPGSPGDIVELPSVCEMSVAAVIAAKDIATSAADLAATGLTFPGGVLKLALAASGTPVLPVCTSAQVPAAGAPPTTQTMTVRASGMVLSNTKLGYLGRPDIGTTTDPADKVFSVAWSAAAEAATSGDTRLHQEARVIARKARRSLYPSDEPCPLASATAGTEGASPSGCYGAGRKRMKDPVAPGPIIRFRVGLVPQSPPAGAAPVPPRDATISFTTQSGFSQVSRRPSLGGMVPGNVVAFDRTAPDPNGNAKPQFAGHENDPVALFVPYGDDQVMVFSPNQSSSQVTSIR